MAWIPSHQELSRHPKTLRLTRQLGQTIPETLGQLHLLWYWCMDFAQDGNLTKHDFADVAHAMMAQVEPQKLRAALVECGFLDEDGARLTLHDWNDYGGKLLQEKRAEAQRKKERRKKAATVFPCPPDGGEMSPGPHAQMPGTSAGCDFNDENTIIGQILPENDDFGSFSCPPDVRGMSGGREEEIREEERRKEKSTGEESVHARAADLAFHASNDLTATTTAGHEGSNGNNPLAELESPLAMAVRKVCLKGKTLSPRDRAKLAYVLGGLKRENATPEQVQEFGRKCQGHWIGRDGQTKQPRAPGIVQVLEHWNEVLTMPEAPRVRSWEELDALAAKFEKKAEVGMQNAEVGNRT